MISIKKLLSQENNDVASSLIRVILMFLETASLHAVEFEPAASASYRTSLRAVREQFEESSTGTDMMLLAGGAIKTMENYNREIERFIQNHGSELQSIVSLLSEALIKVSSSSEVSGQNLRRLEKELEHASKIEDIRVLKGKLATALTSLCEEAARQEERSRDLAFRVSNLQDKPSPEASPLPMAQDEVTGLPGLKKAEMQIRELIGAGKTGYAFVLFLERMDTINKRFGFQIGDQILESFSRATEQRLAGSDRLFRWRGPCFLALLDRSSGFDTVRSDATKIATVRLEHTVETNGRSILLNLSRAWTLIPISPGIDAAAVVRNIDAFAAEQTRLASVPR